MRALVPRPGQGSSYQGFSYQGLRYSATLVSPRPCCSSSVPLGSRLDLPQGFSANIRRFMIVQTGDLLTIFDRQLRKF
jgi:hypothetical protein